MKALVIAEHADAARDLCAGARTVADEVTLVSFGETCGGVADKNVLVTVPEGRILDAAAATVAAVFDAENPSVVLVEPTRRMKVIAGKLAAHADASVITDVMGLEGDVAESMYFGGVGCKRQKATGPVAIYTVGAGCFPDAAASGTDAVEEAVWVEPAAPVKLISSEPIQKSGVDLNKADVVVAAGRGFAEESQLDLARELCGKIGGGLGCTRPLTEGVDWLPRETYIGVSGLMLSPKVYVACGISGQMQHMVGCNRAGQVFAINKDKNAPVFKQCDYGLVGDIAQVLPAVVAAL